jgi:hypothetical protein
MNSPIFESNSATVSESGCSATLVAFAFDLTLVLAAKAANTSDAASAAWSGVNDFPGDFDGEREGESGGAEAFNKSPSPNRASKSSSITSLGTTAFDFLRAFDDDDEDDEDDDA